MNYQRSLIFTLLFGSAISLSAQRVTLKFKGQKLGNILTNISRQTGLSLAYSSRFVDLDKRVTISIRNQDLSSVMGQLLTNTSIGYKLQGKKIYLFYKTPHPVTVKTQVSKTSYQNNPKKDKNNSSHDSFTGIVTDAKGNPIVGASIYVDGKAYGITDTNGRFSIINASPTSKIHISYIGYKSQLVNLVNAKQVILQEKNNLLDETVVVGYGIQKKINLVGAVDQVGSKEIAERANSNISRSLQGLIPGLNITFSDGKPSRKPSINLRGTGSIGAGGSALVLIDGVEGDLNTVNPEDVETVSVLKDASSAAIYGARGAFGVILVTTKKAKRGQIRVNYNGSFSLHQRTVKTEDGIVSNGLEWTNGWYTAYMEGREAPPGGINNVFKYSTDWYNELVKRDADPSLPKVRVNANGEYEYFGNTNWLDLIYKNFNTSTEHNVSISGGSDKASYYISGRYFDQNGIYSAGNEKYTQYNLRSKGSLQINRILLLENNTDISIFRSNQPMVMYDRQNIDRQIEQQGYPMTMPKNPDGTWTEAAVYIGWAGFVEGTSWQKNKNLDVRNTTTLTFTPIKDELIFKGDFTYYHSGDTRLRAENQYNYYTGPTIMKTRNTYSSLENIDYNTDYLSSNITGNYIPRFRNSDHYLNLMLGWNLEHQKYKTIQTYRRGIIYPNKPSFALMDGDYYTENQTGYEWSYVGFLYRLDYYYKNRYLLEVSGRYDASSKFPENQQWGFFPSGSIGWRISEEPFMKETRGWLDNLKLRASIGTLGNGNVDPYLYMATVPINKTSAIIDGELQMYANTPNIIPGSLTWEKSTTYNIGLDMDLFRNRFSIVFDYYQRYTSDMYTVGPTLPAVLGTDSPRGNNAEMETKGWELSAQWRDQFDLGGKPFSYNIKAMIWDNRTYVTKFNNPTNLLSTYYEGEELGTIWGYHIEGLFKDQSEIDSHADQSKLHVSSSNILKPGDLKFGDLNGDKKITNGANTLSDHGDLKVIGNSMPRYQFGLNVGANWNGIGITAFFQGVGKRNWYPHRESAFFWGQYNRPYSYMLKEQTGNNVWTEENQNLNAYWPRYRGYLANGSSSALGIQANDRYLQNVAYVRLKNIQIDYTFHKRICEALHLHGLRVYIAGENLCTWTPLRKHTKMFDPEGINPGDSDFRATANSDGDGYGYPFLSSYTIGVNITF